ncbi:MAG: efflux RND transporter periplasmic adaptor subunit, partial [Gammaproteobacteria bacterium]
VEGYVQSVSFTEGALVQKGTTLYRIDPRPLEAALAQARANLATQQAKLDQAAGAARRLKPLAEQEAVSLQELDNALGNEGAARAQRDAAKAALDKATLDLSYTDVTAPIDGMVGTALVNAGNLVGRGESTLLTTVSQLDPISFEAGLSESEYLRLARYFEATGQTPGEGNAPIELLLSDGTKHLYPGRLDGVERAIDPTTGTLALSFVFPNPERLVRPGQYGRVRIQVEMLKGALVVPQRAVQELQDLHTVAVVDGDGTVAIRTVQVGPRTGNLRVVESGLAAGDKVVVEGLQRLKNGMTVKASPARPSDEDTTTSASGG